MASISLDYITALTADLLRTRSLYQKLNTLRQSVRVKQYLVDVKPFQDFILQADLLTQIVLFSVIAIGEAERVFQGWQTEKYLTNQLQKLADQLVEVENFYDTIGGIVGYHKTVLELMQISNGECSKHRSYLQPPRIDITESAVNKEKFVNWGVRGLPQLAEIYPVGGAGDRLNLVDVSTGESLPAAELLFGGRTLLELLIRDLQARELLYEKMTGENIETPIVLMSSIEKDNNRRIREICEKHHWFGRSKDSFYFIVQPLVPLVTTEGNWVMAAPFKVSCKPGGHGVIWKLMEDQGAFDWLEKQGRTKALVRQINNPLAGEDDGILAFTGIGLHEDKLFGFASCPRKMRATEGMNVLLEKCRGDEREYSLTNIEYTDFEKNGIEDKPEKEGSPYSRFPANTNILFVDLKEVRSIARSCPVPGMLINLKSKSSCLSPDGTIQDVRVGRLESTMQNIADMIVFESDATENQPVYLTYNRREKTIGVTKCSFDSKIYSEETPEICFYKLLALHRDLLEKHCKVRVPKFVSEEEYLKTGPNIIFLYHPTLGPNYSLIGDKIRGGEFADGAEMQIELAEVEFKYLNVSGSLLVSGDYRNASCRLRNVRVENRGINRCATEKFWRNAPVRYEAMEVIFEGRGEFVAKDVSFQGGYRIVVPDGKRVVAFQESSQLILKEEKLPDRKR